MSMKCSKCGSVKFRKNGIKKITGDQRWKCMSCGSEKKPIITKETEQNTPIQPIQPIQPMVSGEPSYDELFIENNRLLKKVQKLTDQKRIYTKTAREGNRVENAYIEYADALRKEIENSPIDFSNVNTVAHDPKASVGIVHISDTHFNELVDIVGNSYDFNIASKRLKLFSNKLVTGFDARGITDITIAITGDLLNSDRRVDELLSMAKNRSMASLTAAKLLFQFIVDLGARYNVSVVSVVGNESRVREDYTQIDALVSDNYDVVIYEIIKIHCKGHPNIKFISGDTFEFILSINGVNILLVHGDKLGKMNSTNLSKTIAKHAQKNQLISHIMCGHLHETNITNTLLRNGSLVGGNAYSDIALNLYSRASQNYYIIDIDGNLDATSVDLQNVTDSDPLYYIDDLIDAYNIKSSDKLKNKTVIYEIVI